jgi:DNA-binding transcriptional regulator YdaS (Cro superfamily)
MENIFERLIDHFDGQTSTGKALGVSQPTVYGWLAGKHGMSPVVALRAQSVTKGKFRAVDLCPALAAAESFTGAS